VATDRDERTETARVQLERIAAGEPFEQVFKVKERVTPAPVITHWAIYTAVDLPSPHGGSTMRSYILDCRHATSQKELMDMDATRDGEVLGPMLRDHRAEVYVRTGESCDCWPKGWALR
jgi:hypothetical protein